MLNFFALSHFYNYILPTGLKVIFSVYTKSALLKFTQVSQQSNTGIVYDINYGRVTCLTTRKCPFCLNVDQYLLLYNFKPYKPQV